MNAAVTRPARRGFQLGVFLGCLLGAASPAVAAHYQLFVLTGQSNSLGTTDGGEVDPSPGVDAADARVRFCWHNLANAKTSLGSSDGAFVRLQPQQGGFYKGSATHWGPEISFGRSLFRAGVTNLGIIKASRGGGGNSFWAKGAADHHMYDHVVKTVTRATQRLQAEGHTYTIAGLLYLQGESDSAAEAAVADQRIKELVDNLRADLPQATAMRAVISGIAATGATRDLVRTKQADIAVSTPYFSTFATTDLRGQMPDALHFNRAAKLTVGERFARAVLSATTSGSPPSAGR